MSYSCKKIGQQKQNASTYFYTFLRTILLFAGRTALHHEERRDYPVVIPLDKNVGNGETDAQVKIVI